MAMPAEIALCWQRGADGFRDAEIGDQRMSALREDVRRFDVAVYDATLVGKGKCVHHVMQNPHDFARTELLLSLEGGAQRFAFDVRHRVPQQIALLSGGEEWNDMWML